MLEVFNIRFIVFLLGALYYLNSWHAQCASVYCTSRKDRRIRRELMISGWNRA